MRGVALLHKPPSREGSWVQIYKSKEGLAADRHVAAPLDLLRRRSSQMAHQRARGQQRHGGERAPEQRHVVHVLSLSLHLRLHHHRLEGRSPLPLPGSRPLVGFALESFPLEGGARGVILVVAVRAGAHALSVVSALALRALPSAVVRAVAVASAGAPARQSAHELLVHADLLARAVFVELARGHAARDWDAAVAAAVALEALEALLVRVGAAAHLGVLD